MICWGVTPCLGVSMTSTSVVGGMAALGTPEPPPDGDCVAAAMGIIAKRNGIIDFMCSPRSQYGVVLCIKSTIVLFRCKKIYFSTKDRMKNSLASIRYC